MKRLILVSLLALVVAGCASAPKGDTKPVLRDVVADARAARERLAPLIAQIDAIVATLPDGPRKREYLATRAVLQLALDAALALLDPPAPATQPSAGAAP